MQTPLSWFDGLNAGALASAGEAVQEAAFRLVRPYDSEQATRSKTALQRVHALAAPLYALRAYLRERASNGTDISTLMATPAVVAVGVAQIRCVPAHPRVIMSTATIIGNCELRAAKG